MCLGASSCVLYGAVVGDDAKLGALTQVMKGEHIPEKSFFPWLPSKLLSERFKMIKGTLKSESNTVVKYATRGFISSILQ